MEIIFNEAQAHASVKDLDFRFAVSLYLETGDISFIILLLAFYLSSWLNGFAQP